MTPSSLDFGEILLGQKRTLTVAVENTGKQPVTVYRTLFSCTCLGGAMEAPVVPPGQSVSLNVTFTGLPGRRSYSAQASVITDEPGACKYDLPIQGKIEQDFIQEPEILSFGTLEGGATKTLEILLKRRDGAPFTITGIKASRPEFNFSWKPAGEGKSSAYSIQVTAKALRPGIIADSVPVTIPEFPGDLAPVLTLSLETEGEFFCNPPVAIARVGTEGKVGPLETQIRSKKGEAVKVEGVKETRDLSVDFSQDAVSKDMVRLIVRFKSDFPPGAPFGELLVSVAGQPEAVHLPYRIELPPAKGSGKP
jgi:hypothetical protein